MVNIRFFRDHFGHFCDSLAFFIFILVCNCIRDLFFFFYDACRCKVAKLAKIEMTHVNFLVFNLYLFIFFYIIVRIDFIFPGASYGTNLNNYMGRTRCEQDLFNALISNGIKDYRFTFPESFSSSVDFLLSNFECTPPGYYLSILTMFLFVLVSFWLNMANFKFGQAYQAPKSRILYFILAYSELSILGVFNANNLFTFYIFFEAVLIPFYFIVGIFGAKPNRFGAAFRLVFFTVIFSLPLTVIVFSNLTNMYFSMAFSQLHSTLSVLPISFQISFYLSAFLAFAVKLPAFPVHIWLPEAHGEAPTFGSVLLAGVLLKLGGYGIFKIISPTFSEFYSSSIDSQINMYPLIYTISILTIIYSNIAVFIQNDIKKIVAYFSIGHIGFVLLGLCSNNFIGLIGGIVTILAHGLSSAALFFSVGYLYEQSGTRDLIAYRGLATTAPIFSLFFFIFICANFSFPMTINFVGEWIILNSVADLDPSLLFLPICGVLLTGFSSIRLLLIICFGETNHTTAKIRDLNGRELFIFGSLATSIILFGTVADYNLFLEFTSGSEAPIIEIISNRMNYTILEVEVLRNVPPDPNWRPEDYGWVLEWTTESVPELDDIESEIEGEDSKDSENSDAHPKN